jgi:serine protease SohB
MGQPIWDVVGFAAKSFVVLITFIACTGFLFSRMRARRTAEPYVRLREISERWRRNVLSIQAGLAATGKRFARKPDMKRPKPEELPKARVFVLDFKGDVMATQTESLREEVTVVLGLAQSGDEVVLRLESSGGAVHGYGLAASQLARLRAKDIPVTVCVDKVAASGGYMMACVGGRVLAAPFAVIGSIGVVAPVPNVHRLLERHGVDYEDVTAGRFKRTVTLLGRITEEGRAKLKEQIEDTHDLFKSFVSEMRPKLDIESVATGEHWYGKKALELGLVDGLSTSDDYLLEKAQSARIFEVLCERPRSVRERAASMAQSVLGWLSTPT